MKQRRKNRRKNPLQYSEQRSLSLGVLLALFSLCILINAGLMTTSSYMLMNRFGIMRPLLSSAALPLFLVLLYLLFALLLATGFGNRSIRPIKKLSRAMKQVSKGDFSTRLNEDEAVGEIRELVCSYNHMAEELSGIEMFRKDFINNFSHEFKTPIISIRGFARQLEREDLTDEQRREYTRIIVTESERLANMSSNILLLSKLENQQIITDKAEYSLDEQIRNCILLLEKQWSDKEIELDLQLDPVTYNGNEEMMSHVWLNLISNAIKFSPLGGLLEISCMRVQNYLHVSIRDHGDGMNMETQARLFEKFYQGDSAHATEGNGLGLPLAKRIVDLCRGKITVTSQIGEGSLFSVYLPLEE